MAQLTLPVGKPEVSDGTNWYTLATENWVMNTIRDVAPCLVATVANLTAVYVNGSSGVGATLTNSGTQAALTLDGVALAVGNRVLVKDQNTALQNGIYTVTNIGSAGTNWILTRATDYDVPAQTVRGDIVQVISGTLSSTSIWMLTSLITTIGTDSFTFAKTDQNSFTAINGTAGQINVNVSSCVATLSLVNTSVTAGSYTLSSITVDAQGRITSASTGSAVTSVTGTTNQIIVSGTTTPTLSLPNAITTPGTLTITGDLTVNSTGACKIAVGTTAQRPATALAGMMRLNTSL